MDDVRADKKQILKSVLLFYVIACGFAWLLGCLWSLALLA